MSARDPQTTLLHLNGDKPTRLDLYIAAVIARSSTPITGAHAVDLALHLIQDVDNTISLIASGRPHIPTPEAEAITGPAARF